jgi:hypothetical protein
VWDDRNNEERREGGKEGGKEGGREGGREGRGHPQEFVEVLVHLQDGRLVATPVAVVGCGEYRHNVHVVRPVVALRAGARE